MSYKTYADNAGIDPAFFDQMINVESGGNPNAVSPTGARGLGQLTGPIIKHYGVTDPFDPDQNLTAASKLFADNLRRRNGNYAAAAADYNGGIAQGDLVMRGMWPSKLETNQYLQKVGLDTSNLRGEKMGTNFPLATAQAMGQNQVPGNELQVAGSGGDMKTYMLPDAVKDQYVKSMERRSANLPLALGAMLSGDKGISNFGGVLYADANAAQNPNKLNANMTLMPDGTVLSTADAQSSYYKQLSAMLTQQKIDGQMLENGVSDSAQNDKLAPWSGQPGKVEIPMRQAANKDAQKIIDGMRETTQKGVATLGGMDRFGQLNQQTSTGSLLDQALPDWARRGNQREMLSIANQLTPLARPEGSGSTSNFEQVMYANSLPSLRNDGPTNANIRERYRVGVQISNERSKFYQEYLAKYGHLNGADAAFEPTVKQYEERYKHLLDNGAPSAGAPSGWSVEQH
jgi:hypothetical protein